MTLSQFKSLCIKAAQGWSANHASRMAAAIAFYAILAFAPLVVFFLTVGSQFLSEGNLLATILHEARAQFGKPTADLVQGMVQSHAKPSENVATEIVTMVLALLGASGLFEQLNLSVRQIWKIPAPNHGPIRGFLRSKLLGVLMVLAFVIVIFAWVGFDSAVSYLRHQTQRRFLPLWHEVSFLGSAALLTAMFAAAFRSLARGMVEWRHVWLPATVTALGFSLAKYLLSFYFGLAGTGAAYGPAGAVVVLLLWFYYSSQIFFFGIELTYAYARGDDG